MHLPIKGVVINWVIGLLVALFIFAAGYQFVKLNGKNLWFCATHSIACQVARLQTTAAELERATVK